MEKVIGISRWWLGEEYADVAVFFTPGIYASVVSSDFDSAFQFYVFRKPFAAVEEFYSFLVVETFVFAI